MGLFKRAKDKGKKGTTKDFFLGNPEAEGEDLNKDFSFTNDFFEDFLDISREINNGKFFILGRKGSGKSAFAKYVQDYSETSTETYSCLLKNSDINIESIIQNLPGRTADLNELLFEWIILTRLIKLIISTGQASFSKNIIALKEFYDKNTGLVEINKLSLVTATDEKSKSLDLSNLWGAFGSHFGKKSIQNYEHAPFYAFVPTLRDIVSETLHYDALKDYEFIVMFDDLDVNFSLKNESQLRKIMDLIRVTRNYNTIYLKDTDAKILLFLRNDIAQNLDAVASDKTKILGAYSFAIDWYYHAEAQVDETKILLRRLINKRIEANFKKFGYRYNHDDPWKSLVNCKDHGYGKKTAFKYILDFTFYRPRDLLNIFKDIGRHEYPIPIGFKDMTNLLRAYSSSFHGEITDELSIIYDRQQINGIDGFLRDIAKSDRRISHSRLKELMRAHSLNHDVLLMLIEYSLIIPVDQHTEHHYFSYREDVRVDNLENYYFTTPHCITLYFNHTKVFPPKRDGIRH